MKATVSFFFAALLCRAVQPIHCQGLTEDFQQCMEAAKAGNVLAQFAMGLLYETGPGVIVQNYEEAIKWYRLSADQGNPLAQVNIGRLYREGKGVSQNYAEAFRWFRMAADEGFPRGQAMVGLTYVDGEGVLQDFNAAVDWCGKAAKQGDDRGQYCLALLYKAGLGVPQDYVQAYMWLNLAGAQGNDDARKDRDEIAPKLTAVQMTQAQRLAREFKPRVAAQQTAWTASAVQGVVHSQTGSAAGEPSGDKPLKIYIATDPSDLASVEVMKLIRQKLGEGQKRQGLDVLQTTTDGDSADFSFALVCMPRPSKGDAYSCSYTLLYAGQGKPGGKTFMDAGIQVGNTAGLTATGLFLSLLQDIIERANGAQRVNAIDNLEACLSLTQSSCAVPSLLVPELKKETISLSQYLQEGGPLTKSLTQ